MARCDSRKWKSAFHFGNRLTSCYNNAYGEERTRYAIHLRFLRKRSVMLLEEVHMGFVLLSGFSQTLKQTFDDILNNIWNYVAMFSIWDVIDLILVTCIVYFFLKLMRKSNAFSVMRGVLILLAILWLSELLKLNVLRFILSSTLQVGLLAIIILFQPEFRKLLGQVGSGSLTDFLYRGGENSLEEGITQTVEACRVLSRDRTGALIVFERKVQLSDFVKTGTVIDAAITAELMKNIFYPKAPLHDGAVIVQSGRITGAGCMLPLSANQNLSRDLGMRHRAGLGISENTDAIVVIVSEETGSLSVATGGMLKRHLAPETLEKLMKLELLQAEGETRKKGLAGFIQRFRTKVERDD